MILPEPPSIVKIESISPSAYEAATNCLARASWAVSGDSSALPAHPSALLGTAVHAVLEHAARTGISGADEDARVQEAARRFDEEMDRRFQDAHPLIRAKFGSQERIPFYYISRARAARVASESPRRHSPHVDSSPAQSQGRDRSRLAERTLTTRDRKIRGRPDRIDVDDGLIVDYKTGLSPDSNRPTESEARQLRLYAHLATENGIAVRAGAIERADRSRVQIPISLRAGLSMPSTNSPEPLLKRLPPLLRMPVDTARASRSVLPSGGSRSPAGRKRAEPTSKGSSNRSVRAGAIERADRSRVEIPISAKEAEEEGRLARRALDALNELSGAPFEEAATPSPDACRHCPCIPFCPAFWRESEPGWAEACGTHLEGIVESIEGSSLASMRLEVGRGTGTRGPAAVSRLSRAWLEVQDSSLPEPGQSVRVTDAGRANPMPQLTEFRADRATTAVWKI